MLSTSKAILTIGMGLLLIAGTATIEAKTPTPRLTAKQRMQARKEARLSRTGKIPKAPKSSSASSAPVARQSSSSSAFNTAAFCQTYPAWTCGSWGECERDGYRHRNCERNVLAILTCKSPETPAPTVQACGFEGGIKQEKAEHWKKVHDEMVSVAKELTQQGEAGRQCLHDLAIIENSFVDYLNQYLQSMNQNGMNWNLVDSLQKLEDEFNASPRVCF